MLKVFLIALILVSNAFATETVRMSDGMNAACKAKYDVFNSIRKNVTAIRNVKVADMGSEVEVSFEIMFLRCTEKNGVYKYELAPNSLSTSYDTLSGKTVTKTDKKREVVAYTEAIEIIGQVDITDGGLSKVAGKMTIAKEKLEVNRFPLALEKGEYFTTIALRTITQYEVGSDDLGSQLNFSGSYRVFFDL